MIALFSAMTQQARCMKPICDLPIECVGRHNLANPTTGTKSGDFHVNSWCKESQFPASLDQQNDPSNQHKWCGEKRSTKHPPLNLKLTKPYTGQWPILLVTCEMIPIEILLIDPFLCLKTPAMIFS